MTSKTKSGSSGRSESVLDIFDTFDLFPVNMPDQIQKQTVIAITASVQPESGGRIVYIPDPTSVVPNKARILLCKISADPIWLAWSGFGQTYLVQKQLATVCKDHRARFCQNATCPLPVSLLSDTVAFVKLPPPLSLSLTHAIFSWNSLRLSLAPCSFSTSNNLPHSLSLGLLPGSILFIGVPFP